MPREPQLLVAFALSMIVPHVGFVELALPDVAPSHLLSWPVSCSIVSDELIGLMIGMYLGGKFVLGSGNCWPQDFRFLTGFFSGAGVPALLPSIESPNSSSNDRGVFIDSDGSMEWKSDGYDSPGVESKLSARLSTGECSNLM